MAFGLKQIASQKRQVASELRRDLKRKDQERLAALRGAIRDAKSAKKQRLADVRGMCRSNRERLREKEAQLRAELRERIAAERIAARTSCSTNRATARTQGQANIARAVSAFTTARADVKRERIWDPSRDPLMAKKKRGRSAAAREVAVRRTESDDEVRNNLPPDLIPVFEAVKRGIREGARRSRTEAFLEWVHDHPGRVWEIMEQQAAADLERMEREESRLAREVKSGRRYRRSAGELAASLAEVPF